jgi:hypothetical protein
MISPLIRNGASNNGRRFKSNHAERLPEMSLAGMLAGFQRD